MALPSSIICETSTVADGNMSFRFGDVDEVVNNRRRFLKRIGGDYAECIPMACDHGCKITTIYRSLHLKYFGSDLPETMIESEVLITNEKNLALMLLTADCLPTVFYDPVREAMALAHLNRHTIAHDLGQKTIEFMGQEFGSEPTDLLVNIGPHIKPGSYRFSLPLHEPPPPQLQNFMIKTGDEVQIDLVGAELAQLTKLGVKPKSIFVSDIDTAESPEHFSHYQHRREPTAPAGRLATVAMIVA